MSDPKAPNKGHKIEIKIPLKRIVHPEIIKIKIDSQIRATRKANKDNGDKKKKANKNSTYNQSADGFHKNGRGKKKSKNRRYPKNKRGMESNPNQKSPNCPPLLQRFLVNNLNFITFL